MRIHILLSALAVPALATLLGEPDAGAFGRWLQANYGELFAELERPEELLARIAARRG